MKTFYVLPKEANVGLSKLYSVASWIELSSGEVLVAAEFSSGQETFESHPLVTALPHPQRPNASIGKDIAERLSDLGVNESLNTWDVADAASKLHRGMKI